MREKMYLSAIRCMAFVEAAEILLSLRREVYATPVNIIANRRIEVACSGSNVGQWMMGAWW